ncbi:T9SS type A sorting domain-containing protein, partial [candidate division FCPU426 bacterium]|nr:T9SS type A sorting domain-containing protein [candidate division FCPU426 bacterium]
TITNTYTATPTFTATPTITLTNTVSPTLTPSPTVTPTPTITMTQTPTTTAEPARNLENVVVFPNPYVEKQANYKRINFIRLTFQANVRIYTITGQLVWEGDKNDGSDRLVWEGVRNSSGNRLASGVYIYVITNEDGERRTGKVAILR